MLVLQRKHRWLQWRGLCSWRWRLPALRGLRGGGDSTGSMAIAADGRAADGEAAACQTLSLPGADHSAFLFFVEEAWGASMGQPRDVAAAGDAAVWAGLSIWLPRELSGLEGLIFSFFSSL